VLFPQTAGLFTDIVADKMSALLILNYLHDWVARKHSHVMWKKAIRFYKTSALTQSKPNN
jgi:hypothetical protein